MSKILQVRRSVAAVVLAAALLLGGGLVWALSTGSHPVLGAPGVVLQVAPGSAEGSQITLQGGFADIVEPALPAVVNIRSSRMVQTQSPFPFSDDPFFRRFFGDQFDQDQQPQERRERGLGSGVIVSRDGYILTNNHVVEDASEVKVTLKDKRELTAEIVGTDPRTDLAVLKINADNLTPITLGDSSKLRVGDFVLAIGDPFGIGETVTMGIVSATGRRGLGIAGPEGYEDFIQTDAAINPGNSGGALINVRGELVGINTAIISRGSGGNQGIGFAIPVEMARRVMEQLITTGKVTRGYLGIMIQEVTPDLAKAFGLESAQGALVGDVTQNSPAAKAGLQKGDVIVTLNGEPVADSLGLRLRISQMRPGSSVKLGVLRNGQRHEVTATLDEYPETTETAAATPQRGEETSMRGVQVGALTADIARQLNLEPGTRGVVVTRVDPNSAAADSGLRRGDVIQEVNRNPVSSVAEFRSAVRAAGNQPILLLVNRGGTTSFVVVSPQ